MAKKSKFYDTIKDYEDKQAQNLSNSIESTNDSSKSFLGPMLVIVLTIIALFSTYWAVSRVSSKPLKTKFTEISTYIENNLPSWQAIRLLGYQQEAEILTYGYLYNIYFSTVDTDSLPSDVNLGEWAEANYGKLYGLVVVGIDNGSYITQIGEGDMFLNDYVTTLRVDGHSINCVSFYGLTGSLSSEEKMYNPYSEFGRLYIPSDFINNPDDYADTPIPVYKLTGDLVSPTYTDDNSFASVVNSVFSGFKLIGNVVLTGFSFVEFLLGLIWVIFT